MSDSLKSKTVKGVMWSSIDRFTTQGISFVFSMLIARMLLPSDYGVIGMLAIFMSVSQCFIDSGFGTALVRKNDRTEEDFCTVFYFNIAVACICYALLFLASPYIARFYNLPLLESVTKVWGLNLIISSFAGIQNAQLTIAIDFKSRAKISVITTLFTGGIGLWLAYRGYGVWALVFQTLSSNILRTILLWAIVRWMPKLIFSWQSFKELFSFGSKLLASSLLDTVYNNIYPIVIGKFFSASSLGVYSRADSLARFPSSNITGVLQSVTFPVLSTIQDDETRLSNAYRRFLRISAFVIFPLMVGLSAVADPFIRLVLTDKWEGAIYLLQILCFALMWYPIHAINLNLLQVKGRSDYFLRLEVIKKILGVAILCVTIPLGLVAMCYGHVIFYVVCLGINTYYTKKIIDYGFLDQMKDLLHILVHSLVMYGIVLAIVYVMPTLWSQLLVGTLAGMAYYIIGAYLMKFDEMNELILLLKHRK
ncbi:MAG: lipopolysaccharide biosynthesis protein [Bacteroidales bacterium]|nr:lipopolysaccharide biosynthesis protein [Bacteroidales bacterium]